MLTDNPMTPNRSLALSLQFEQFMRHDMLKHFSEIFPYDIIQRRRVQGGLKSRDRVYTEENTLLSMLLSGFQEDKSLQNSVNLFQEVFHDQCERIRQQEMRQIALERKQDEHLGSRPGRPKLYKPRLPLSKTRDISSNTAAYSKARGRLDVRLMEDVFNWSGQRGQRGNTYRWHGMAVYMLDGAYFQMQDTEALRQKYYVKQDDGAYPQGLLEAIIQQGGGQVATFAVGTRHQSELELAAGLLNKVPPGALLLGDDLYNCFGLLAMAQSRGIHMLVSGKRKRNYRLVKELSPGDQVVEITRSSKSEWVPKGEMLPNKLLLRRIEFLSPGVDAEIWTVYTTLTDESISKTDMVAKYLTRWDIEISIREIKTLMGLTIARSKTEEMVFKEFYAALTAYNMVRSLMAESVRDTDFSPKGGLIQEFIEGNKELLIDKKGRVYSRWSPGRAGKTQKKDPELHNTPPA